MQILHIIEQSCQLRATQGTWKIANLDSEPKFLEQCHWCEEGKWDTLLSVFKHVHMVRQLHKKGIVLLRQVVGLR